MSKRLLTLAIVFSVLAGPIPARAWAYEPVADKACQVGSDQNRQRQAYMQKQLESAGEDVAHAEKALRIFQQLLDSYNSAYTVSKWLSAGAAVAFTIATAGAGWEAVPGVMMLGTVGYLGTDAISQILGAENPRIRTIDEEFLAIIEPSKTTTPADEAFYADERFDPIRALVSSPHCGSGQCAPWHPYIEQMIKLAKKAWNTERKRLDDENAWWKPDAFTHIRGRTFAEADIPFAKMMVALTKGRVKFYEAVLKTLQNDGRACSRRTKRCYR